MADHRLRAPLSRTQIENLRVGDSVRLDGTVLGIRDATLIRLIDERASPPVDLTGAVLLHTAPGVKKVGGRYQPVSIGTTTSMRMDRFTEPLLRDHGVRAIIGKGGLSATSLEAFRQHSGCYLAIVGGAAALETTQIEEIEAVYWEDLMPECLWRFRVKELGPLTVAMDAHGGNLYAEVMSRAEGRLQDIFSRLGL
ncbi:MAG: FumA C-terminus/TtdB family hydratase beta subunit [Candidatus Methylomirabilales bacterium]